MKKVSQRVCVIPARGGSKGIPRKNLRPINGKPLIWYSIDACLQSKLFDLVVVSTDDEEISLFAERFGAAVHFRDKTLADDITTLDPVVIDVSEKLEELGLHLESNDELVIVTVQPTSPLVCAHDLQRAVEQFEEGSSDTVVSACEDMHLEWGSVNGAIAPLYKERINRQELPLKYRENGAIVVCGYKQLRCGTRFGSEVSIYTMPKHRSFDIDDVHDIHLVESILQRKKICFVVIGNTTVGSGHVYRALMIANEFPRHSIEFVCFEGDDLASKLISDKNYSVTISSKEGILQTLGTISPDLVVNDILNTEEEYVASLKRSGAKVVNFEDLGDGRKHADLVINALYEYEPDAMNELVGSDYFCLRDEFILGVKSKMQTRPSILITFGGVDEGNLTCLVLESLVSRGVLDSVNIDLVTGQGYVHNRELNALLREMNDERIAHFPATTRISEFMMRADLAITSAGRTVFELAALGTPGIVICQNERETTHTFATLKNGYINIGLRNNESGEVAAKLALSVLDSEVLLDGMRAACRSEDLTRGKFRVVRKIESLMDSSYV